MSNVYKVSYRIVYNANGGTSTPNSQIKNHNENITLAGAIYKANNVFLGWSTSSSATSVTYKAGATYTENKAVTLYAVWGVANYSVNTNPVTYTTTLSDAVAASNTTGSSVITVLRDVTDTVYANVNKPLTIETNGKTLSRTTAIDVSGQGVYIQGNGTIQTDETTHLIYNSGNGILTIADNVTIKSNVTASGYYPTILNAGMAYIKGDSKIIGGNYSALATTGTTEINENANITTKSGERAVELANTGSIYIKGNATITNSNVAIYKDSSGVLQIEGGNINCNNGKNEGYGIQVSTNASGRINVNNGKINAGYAGIISDSKQESIITVNGGTIDTGVVGIWSKNYTSTITNGGKIKGIYGLLQEATNGVMNVVGTTNIEATYGIEIRNTASVLLGENANITSTSEGIISQSSGGITVSDNSIINGQNGTGVHGNSSGPVIISGGTITGETAIRRSGNGTVTISGGKMTGTGNGIYADGTSGQITIYNGNITGGQYGIQNIAGNSLQMTAGTVTGNAQDGLHSRSSQFCYIDGGSIIGGVHGYVSNSSAASRIHGTASIEGINAEGLYLLSSGSMSIAGTPKITGTTGINHSATGQLTIVDSPTIIGKTKNGLEVYSSGAVSMTSGGITGASSGIVDFANANLSIAGTISGNNVGIYVSGSGGSISVNGGTVKAIDGIQILNNKLFSINNTTINSTGGTSSGTGILLKNCKQLTQIRNTIIQGGAYGINLDKGTNIPLGIYSTTIDAGYMGIVDNGGCRMWLYENTHILASTVGIQMNAIGSVEVDGVMYNGAHLDIRGNSILQCTGGDAVQVSVSDTDVWVQENAQVISNATTGIYFTSNTKRGGIHTTGNGIINANHNGIISDSSANIEVRDNSLVQGSDSSIVVRNHDSTAQPIINIYAKDATNGNAGGLVAGMYGLFIEGSNTCYGAVVTITGNIRSWNGNSIVLNGNTLNSVNVSQANASLLYGNGLYGIASISNSNTNAWVH